MTHASETTTPRLLFTLDAGEAFLQRLREELDKTAVEAVTVDMEQVTYLGPEALGVLAAAGTQARTSGKLLLIDHVRVPVYKTLQLAKLAAFFRRVHHG